MKRRTFIESAGTGAAALMTGCRTRKEAVPCLPSPGEGRLAGMTLPELRKHFRDELFQVYLPFWDKHGIDHELGGFICSLDYDGKRVNTDKLLWFQGRGIWVYSFLYNHFDRNPRYLEIAKKTKDFVTKHGPQPDGWWAEVLTRDGKVRKPFQGDVYGMYFIAEGLQEYAWATKDEQALELSLSLIKKLHGLIEDPKFRVRAPGQPSGRAQGLWMVNMNIATQILRRWKDPGIAAIADQAVDAIINKHYNPEIGLNNEELNFDFTRPKGEETKSLLGHSVETLWMVMDDARRRNDDKLWDTCAERIHRHLEVGWDHVYGGLAQWINVDQGGYVWPVETPIGTDFKFQFTGEFNYMKALWALNEVQVAALNVFERTRVEWAARFFDLAEEVTEQKHRKLRKYGLPGYMLFAARRMEHQEHVSRQDNYHPPRQLMLNILTLDRMIEGKGEA